ncbi:MAG: hypothetical protein CVU06_08425, partial [Bacteroidetes bacterium HGW-Bacteroidetes-22]
MSTSNNDQSDSIELTRLQKRIQELEQQIRHLKVTEAMLTESREHYQTTLQSIGDAVITTDKSGLITGLNPAAESLTGWDHTKAVGQSVEAVFNTSNVTTGEKTESTVKKVLESGQVVTMANHTKLIAADGREYHISDSGAPIRNKEGAITGVVLVFRDVTESYMMREKIRVNETNYHYLFEHNPHPMLVYDLNTLKFLAVNDTALVKYGYTREEFMELSVLDIRPDDEKEKLMQNIITSTQPIQQSKYWKHKLKDGTLIYVDIHSHSLRYLGREARLVVVLDVTERARAEQELAESEERFYSLFNDSPIPSSINRSTDHILTEVNLAWCVFFGYTHHEAIGHSLEELHIIRADEPAHHLEPGNQENPTTSMEATVHTKSGDKKQAIIYFNQLRAGDQLYLVHQIVNITERIEAENKIREKDIQFRKLSANLPDMIYQFTRKTDGSYSVPISSEGIWNIFGCKHEDVREDFDPIVRVIHPDDAARVMNDIRYSEANLSDFTCEFRVKVPDRPLKWIFSRSTPELLPDGSITWYGFIANITDKKNYEEALLKAKEKAEESDRLKSAFLANMSHEIRTPMNGIMGFTELLREPDLDSDNKNNFIEIIHKSGQRMLDTLNDIIEMSQIEAGVVSINPTPVDMESLLSELTDFYQREAKRKNLILTFEKPARKESTIITTDDSKISSIISNLIKNAIIYTRRGVIKVGMHSRDETLTIFVSDTGIGIPANRQAAVFQRFEQVDISMTRPFEGSGLGLAITKNYVELLGGNIKLVSVEDEGSTFYVELPCKGEKNSRAETLQNEKPIEIKPAGNSISGLKILIAEDDEPSYTYLSTILKAERCEVFH